MREILFRGKRIDNWEWAYGGLFENSEEEGLITYIYQFRDGALPVIHETVGQFTGLHDKNGKMVFEGDKFGNENMPVRHVVFEDGKFCFNRVHSQGADTLSQDRVGRLEIIGNIHDTIYDDPELIIIGGVK